MVGIVGLPGSCHHEWKWFPRHGTVDGESIGQWVQRRWREKLNANPALGTLPTEIVSDRAARRRRYRDGSRCYPTLENTGDPYYQDA